MSQSEHDISQRAAMLEEKLTNEERGPMKRNAAYHVMHCNSTTKDVKTKLEDWKGKTMSHQSQVRTGIGSAITLHSECNASRIAPPITENVRDLLRREKRIRMFWERYGFIALHQFNGKSLRLRRDAETDRVPEEIRSGWEGRIRFEHPTRETASDFYQNIIFPQRGQLARFTSTES
jgi:hypothetical protein